MKISIGEKTPKPDDRAFDPVSWAVGPADGVIRGEYATEATPDQKACILGAKPGDILVSFDKGGLVHDMHLSFGNRFVQLQDGFETDHAIVLLEYLGIQVENAPDLRVEPGNGVRSLPDGDYKADEGAWVQVGEAAIRLRPTDGGGLDVSVHRNGCEDDDAYTLAEISLSGAEIRSGPGNDPAP